MKPFHLRFWMYIVAALFFIAGLSGFFIPFESFSLNRAEINQKSSLEQQNMVLSTRVRSMRSLLGDLRQHVEGLARLRRDIEPRLGSPVQRTVISRRSPPISDLPVDSILTWAQRYEQVFGFFSGRMRDNPVFFDGLPLLRPVVGTAYVTAGFGMQKDPFTGTEKMHNAVDFAAPAGTSVISTGSGIVVEVDLSDPHWGRRIVIDHSYGLSTVYAHLAAVSVRCGQQVTRGTIIGSVGISGVSTGPHVHYAILRNGSPLDPFELIMPDGLFAAKN